ncbi:hypothetical protein [Paenibacillus sp. PCH8]|nr:hypothetical protein [Paenibacillus sp. PCH8]
MNAVERKKEQSMERMYTETEVYGMNGNKPDRYQGASRITTAVIFNVIQD